MVFILFHITETTYKGIVKNMSKRVCLCIVPQPLVYMEKHFLVEETSSVQSRKRPLESTLLSTNWKSYLTSLGLNVSICKIGMKVMNC